MRDGFGREITYLRMSVTELCNLRCRYCMPAEGVHKRRHEEMLTQEETLLALRVAAELGMRKLRITGGEPLVKRNIVAICEGAATIPGIEEIGLTTNGTLLPPLAEALRLMLPAQMRGGRVKVKTETLARLTVSGAALEAAWRGDVLATAGLAEADLAPAETEWLAGEISERVESMRLDVRGVQRALAARLQRSLVEHPDTLGDVRDANALAEAIKSKSLELVREATGAEVLP